jgi:DNA-directed RNA polymerase specialized sigma24 family protein
MPDFTHVRTEENSEAAEILGVTPDAVKLRLHWARQAMRTLLEREAVSTGRAWDPR